MLALSKALGNASAKLVATFFMVILLMLTGLVFFPTQLNQLNDFANYVANWEVIRNPDIPEQGKFLFRTLVNESTVFGILTTLISRAIVEVLFYTLGAMWRVANRDDDHTGPDLLAEMVSDDVTAQTATPDAPTPAQAEQKQDTPSA